MLNNGTANTGLGSRHYLFPLKNKHARQPAKRRLPRLPERIAPDRSRMNRKCQVCSRCAPSIAFTANPSNRMVVRMRATTLRRRPPQPQNKVRADSPYRFAAIENRAALELALSRLVMPLNVRAPRPPARRA
jgi:hypothetical protein